MKPKARERQRETMKTKQKMPSLGGKQVFFAKNKRKNRKKTKQNKPKNKEFLGPSGVAPYLTLKQKQKK